MRPEPLLCLGPPLGGSLLAGAVQAVGQQTVGTILGLIEGIPLWRTAGRGAMAQPA